MKLKPILIISACFVVVISGIFIVNKITKSTNTMKKMTISADYSKHDTLEDLADRADTIVKGKIVTYIYSDLNITQEVDYDDEYRNPGGNIDNSTMPYTVYTVKIEKSYKGDYAENDIIQVKQLGGISENTEYVLEDCINAKLEEEHNYVLFLETYLDSPASLSTPLQGSYEYDENDNMISNTQKGKNNRINFTIQELDNIMILK